MIVYLKQKKLILEYARVANQNLATKLEKDIKDCQWGSESRESFLSASSLLRKKYLELETDSQQLF